MDNFNFKYQKYSVNNLLNRKWSLMEDGEMNLVGGYDFKELYKRYLGKLALKRMEFAEFVTLVKREKQMTIAMKEIDKLSRQRNKLNERISMLEDLALFGEFFIETWSRDCDMCESTSVARYTSMKEYDEAMDAVEGWAEGPVSFTHISKEDADKFEPHTRDRVMEAYENGNGWSIHV